MQAKRFSSRSSQESGRRLAEAHATLERRYTEISRTLATQRSDDCARELASFFDKITAHFSIEEEVYFAVLESQENRSTAHEIETLRTEHQEFIREIEQIKKRVHHGEFDVAAGRFDRLAERLATHDAAEEDLWRRQST